MSSWVRCCRTIIDWDGERIPDGTPREEWADPMLVQYCGRLATERKYGDDDLAAAFEESWSCPWCGGSEYEFAEWPPSAEVGYGQE